MRDSGRVELRDEIRRVSDQVEPVTLAEVMSHPVVTYDAESDAEVELAGGASEPFAVVELDAQRRGRRWWITGLVATAAAVLAVAGLAVLQGEDKVRTDIDRAGGDDQPVSTQPLRLPDMSGSSGTVQTPLGSLSWVHASDAGDLLPSPGSVIQTPTGFAGIAHLEDSSDRLTSVWVTSPDGAAWTMQPFPVPAERQGSRPAVVGGADGRYWISDGTGLWLSDDAEDWAAIDLSTLTPPPSTGLLWKSGIEIEPGRRPASAGPVTVFSWSADPVLPLGEIFGIANSEFTGGVSAVNCGWYWDPPCETDDEYVVIGVDAATGDEMVLAHFRMDGDGDTGIVVDVVTGSPLHEITLAGFDGDHAAWAELPTWNAVGVVDSDESLLVVEPPWPSFGDAPPVIVAVQGRFFAFVNAGPSPRPGALDAVEVWESADGATWTSRGTADFGIELSGETHVELDVSERGSYLVARIDYDLEQITPSSVELRSSDGFDWQPMPTNAGSDVEEVRNGFIALGDRVWMSADGSTWAPLSILERPPATAFVVGDTLIVAYEPDGGPLDTFDTWAFDIEP